MKLYELFDRTVPYTIKSDPIDYGGIGYRGVFVINKKEYTVRINVEYSEDEYDDTYAEVTFSMRFPSDHQLFQRDGITGSGDQYIVFSTVLKIIQEVTESNPNIKMLEFSAYEPSRKKLYQRMVQYFTKKTEWEWDKHYGPSFRLVRE